MPTLMIDPLTALDQPLFVAYFATRQTPVRLVSITVSQSFSGISQYPDDRVP